MIKYHYKGRQNTLLTNGKVCHYRSVVGEYRDLRHPALRNYNTCTFILVDAYVVNLLGRGARRKVFTFPCFSRM